MLENAGFPLQAEPMTHRIRIEPSGHEFECEPDETVLESALRHGHPMPYSCRNGSCGTCKGRIHAGEVDYGEFETKALSQTEIDNGFALFCQAMPLEDLTIEVAEVGAAGDLAIRTLPTRVAGTESLAHDVMRVLLKLPASERLQFLAGQYVDILLKDGRRRGFSLANPPFDDEFLELHVRHVPGGHFTDHVFHRMKERDILRIEGPLGTFYLREESDRPVIMMAGGTGFAPVKAMLEQAIAAGDRRPIHVYWGVRSLRDLYLGDYARQLAADHANIAFVPVLSEPQPEDAWNGRTGLVHEAVVADHEDLSTFDVYASGPPQMVDAGKAAFTAAGLPEDHYYFDSFEYAADSRPST